MNCNRLIVLGLSLFWPLVPLALTTSQDYLLDAKAYYERGEYQVAVIQLKNALSIDPGNADARLLLG